jgi:hypothetical protein
MAEQTNEEKMSSRVSFIKRNCSLCKARSRLRPAEGERKQVRTGLENLIGFFQNQFNALRREDAPTGKISNAIGNKRLCMDLLEECGACDKEVDLVNRGLNKILK